MPVLYTILGIILFFVIIFSVPFGVIVDYGEKTVVALKWLFVKITVVDTSKPKKEKKKKEKKKKEDKPEEKKEDKPKEEKKPKEKGNSLLKQIYNDHGYDGLVKMLGAVGDSLSGFFGSLWKSFTIDELYIDMVTATGDAAQTAIKHGKLCAYAFPILGKLISTCKVKKYDFDFNPDFLASKSTAEAYVRLHVIPIKITNAAVVLVFRLLFRVVLKLLVSVFKNKKKAPKAPVPEKVKNASSAAKADEDLKKSDKNNNDKDGVS